MPKQSYYIVALPGDGIGTEVLSAALRVLGAVGQSFDVAVLALIEAPSTAEVTALMCSGDPFAAFCASAAVAEIVSPNAIASAKRAGRRQLGGVSAKKRQAESTRGERVI